MLDRTLHNESMPLEMVEPTSEHRGRNFAIWAGNLAFRLYAAQEQDGTQVRFTDVTYINYRHLETVPRHAAQAADYLSAMRDTDEIGKEYRLRLGDRVTVGREAGMQVYTPDGRLIGDALSRTASKLVQLDDDLAPIHFSVSLLESHIAVVHDQSGDAGTQVQERRRL